MPCQQYTPPCTVCVCVCRRFSVYHAQRHAKMRVCAVHLSQAQCAACAARGIINDACPAHGIKNTHTPFLSRRMQTQSNANRRRVLTPRQSCEKAFGEYLIQSFSPPTFAQALTVFIMLLIARMHARARRQMRTRKYHAHQRRRWRCS